MFGFIVLKLSAVPAAVESSQQHGHRECVLHRDEWNPPRARICMRECRQAQLGTQGSIDQAASRTTVGMGLAARFSGSASSYLVVEFWSVLTDRTHLEGSDGGCTETHRVTSLGSSEDSRAHARRSSAAPVRSACDGLVQGEMNSWRQRPNG